MCLHNTYNYNMIKNTGHQFFVTVSKCFLRWGGIKASRVAFGSCTRGSRSSPPTHYLTPLTARTEATIQGDVLQNTFRLFLCLLKRGFSPIIRKWVFWLVLINTFVLNTEHFNFKLYWIHCIAFQVRRQGLLCPLVFWWKQRQREDSLEPNYNFSENLAMRWM